MSLNRVVITGRVGAAPKMSKTESGCKIANFSLAVPRNFINKKTNEREIDWIQIVAFGSKADLVEKYFDKGVLITIEGHLQTQIKIDKEGNKRKAMGVVVDIVHFVEIRNNREKTVLNQMSEFPDIDEY